jgi:hypothetical protein
VCFSKKPLVTVEPKSSGPITRFFFSSTRTPAEAAYTISLPIGLPPNVSERARKRKPARAA